MGLKMDWRKQGNFSKYDERLFSNLQIASSNLSQVGCGFCNKTLKEHR